MVKHDSIPAVVVGGGVMGLSCAIQLVESGRFAPVTCIAEAFPPHTTSDGAGALWRPVYVDGVPQKQCNHWAKQTFDHLLALVQQRGQGSMLHLCEGDELFTSRQPDPFWSGTVMQFRRTSPTELKLFNGRREASRTQPFLDGYHYRSVMINSPLYLQYLMRRFSAAGGVLKQESVTDLLHLSRAHSHNGNSALVVNCTGLGARELCNDKHITSARGQTVRVTAGAVRQFLVVLEGEYSLSYTLPRDPDGSKEVVLGGTYQLDDWDEGCREGEVDRIIQNCARFTPELRPESVRRTARTWTGFRPVRSSDHGGVRLEVDERCPMIIHNYGHGGSGMTLHWGCSAHVLELGLQCLQRCDQTRVQAKL